MVSSVLRFLSIFGLAFLLLGNSSQALAGTPKKTARKTATVKKTTSQKKTTTKKVASRTTSPKDNISSLRNRRSSLQKKIKNSESQLASTNRDVKRKLNDIAILDGKIAGQKQHIQELQTRIDSLNKNIQNLTNEYNKLCRQLKMRRQKYKQSILYLYKNKGMDNKLLFILSSQNFHQMMRRSRYVGEYSKYQKQQGKLIQKKQEEINTIKQQLQQTKQRQASTLASHQVESQRLTQQQDEQKRLVKGLEKKQVAIKNVIAQNKKEIAQLDAKIEYFVQLAIEQERKRREAELARQRERERQMAQNRNKEIPEANNGNHTSDKNSRKKEKYAPMEKWRSSSKEYTLSNNFASNKGRLPMPITGNYIISARYGNYSVSGTKGVQLNNKGINLTGQSGAQARCIFPGEVSAVFSFGGYVNILVRHGSYISVYCNLASSNVSRGQQVGARAILGTIARDASGQPTLHFQLRKETATLNPLSWLAR